MTAVESAGLLKGWNVRERCVCAFNQRRVPSTAAEFLLTSAHSRRQTCGCAWRSRSTSLLCASGKRCDRITARAGVVLTTIQARPVPRSQTSILHHFVTASALFGHGTRHGFVTRKRVGFAGGMSRFADFDTSGCPDFAETTCIDWRAFSSTGAEISRRDARNTLPPFLAIHAG